VIDQVENAPLASEENDPNRGEAVDRQVGVRPRARARDAPVRLDDPGAGRLYVCVEVCLPFFANLAGYLAPDQAEELRERVAVAAETEVQLRADLEKANDKQLVSLADLERVIHGRKLAKAGKD
jgi:hypothetical protein